MDGAGGSGGGLGGDGGFGGLGGGGGDDGGGGGGYGGDGGGDGGLAARRQRRQRAVGHVRSLLREEDAGDAWRDRLRRRHLHREAVEAGVRSLHRHERRRAAAVF